MNGSFSKPKLVQVGLVVRDLDKTMQQFKLQPMYLQIHPKNLI